MTPVLVTIPLTYREAHLIEKLLTAYLTNCEGNPVAECEECGADLMKEFPDHSSNCPVQVAHDILNRFSGHPLPHEQRMWPR